MVVGLGSDRYGWIVVSGRGGEWWMGKCVFFGKILHRQRNTAVPC